MKGKRKTDTSAAVGGRMFVTSRGVGCIGDGSIPNHVGLGASIRCNMNHMKKKEKEKEFFFLFHFIFHA